MFKLSEWQLVGSCPVDAGCVMLMDPCYTHHQTGDDWQKWYDSQIVDRCYENSGRHHGVKIEDHALESSGVIVEAGYGDGDYPVYVRLNGEGRVAEVKVVFIGDDDDDY